MLVNLRNLINQFSLKINGVLHIGAHYGEEYPEYVSAGITKHKFIEPLKSNFEVLISNVPREDCINVALGSSSCEIDMFVETANKGQSSSILQPALHLLQYPHIKFESKEKVVMTTLDSLNFIDYNFINMDVQGYELEVLRGGTKTLEKIDYIYCEVNRAEVYKDCAQVQDLDEFLKQFGFERKLTSWEGFTWGDALYVKQ
jgi:FkbM family methyltransferase